MTINVLPFNNDNNNNNSNNDNDNYHNNNDNENNNNNNNILKNNKYHKVAITFQYVIKNNLSIAF